MKKVCVVIFLYKKFQELSYSELASLSVSFSCFRNESFVFVVPEEFDCSDYLDCFNNYNISFTVKEFSNDFFAGTDTYNKLLLSSNFYSFFLNYKYILIYQTDAWVFRNELDAWIAKDYDYIGAPWFSSMTVCDPTASIIGVGNGGFSLRNVKSTYSVLKRVEQLRRLHRLWDRLGVKRMISFNKLVLRLNFYFKIAKFWEVQYLLDESPVQEDVFLCFTAASVFSDYKVAPAKEAMKFSFEVNPALLYEMNANELPFGCHAWEKYDPNFWKQFIN